MEELIKRKDVDGLDGYYHYDAPNGKRYSVVDFGTLATNFGAVEPIVITPSTGSGGVNTSSCLHYFPKELGGGVTPCWTDAQAVIVMLNK